MLVSKSAFTLMKPRSVVETQRLRQRWFLLADGLDDLIRGNHEFRARHRAERGVRMHPAAQFHTDARQARYASVLRDTPTGCVRKRNSTPSFLTKSYSCG